MYIELGVGGGGGGVHSYPQTIDTYKLYKYDRQTVTTQVITTGNTQLPINQWHMYMCTNGIDKQTMTTQVLTTINFIYACINSQSSIKTASVTTRINGENHTG